MYTVITLFKATFKAPLAGFKSMTLGATGMSLIAYNLPSSSPKYNVPSDPIAGEDGIYPLVVYVHFNDAVRV